MKPNEEKLNQWAQEIYKIATAHGWHDTEHTNYHYLCLTMCEVAEMVEADRKRITDANLEGFKLLKKKIYIYR